MSYRRLLDFNFFSDLMGHAVYSADLVPSLRWQVGQGESGFAIEKHGGQAFAQLAVRHLFGGFARHGGFLISTM